MLLPMSGQQKGFDLALLRRQRSGTKVATFQVKSSRTYPGKEGDGVNAKGVRTFIHYTWLNRFAVQPEADFFVLIALYAPDPRTTRGKTGLWKPHLLLYTNAEMSALIRSIKTKKTAAPDSKFGFGFNNASQAFLTRGNPHEQTHPDDTHRLLARRHADIAALLA